jgi:hypothetical protein
VYMMSEERILVLYVYHVLIFPEEGTTFLKIL